MKQVSSHPAKTQSLSRLTTSQEIINSGLLFVVAIFMLEVIPTSSSIQSWGLPVLLVCILAKFFVYSGILGCLIEVASEEEIVFSWKNFTANAKKYWKLYLILSFIPLIAFYILTFLFPAQTVSMPVLSLGLRFVILYIFAKKVIENKYVKPFELSPQKTSINALDMLILLVLFAASAFLVNLPLIIPSLHSIYYNVASFIEKYLELLIFAYLAVTMIAAYPDIKKRHNPPRQMYMINPLGGGIINGIASLVMRWYPPVFVILKALSPKHYKTRGFNRVTWRKRYYKENVLVAVTCFTSNCAEAYKIAKEFKKRGCKVVMGGAHVSYHPQEALQFCDSVVLGEAEGVWKEVIRDYENNSLKPTYQGVAVEDFYSEVHQELLNSPPEIIKDFIETTRGCKFRCAFCTIPSLSGGWVRKKPIHEVVELINKAKHKYKLFNFIDNNIYSDPAYARELFKALKPLKIKWTTQCTIDIAKNEETLRLAKESGCVGFLFGYEIFGGSLEKNQGGKFALAEKYIKFSRIIKEMGIKIKAHFIFGFESDNFKNIFKLWKFCFNVKPSFTCISLLTPLPGSQVYREMLRDNQITNLNWRNYATHDLVFRHKLMNQYLLAKVYPVIRYLFLVTTSTGGFVIVGLIILWLTFALATNILPFT